MTSSLSKNIDTCDIFQDESTIFSIFTQWQNLVCIDRPAMSRSEPTRVLILQVGGVRGQTRHNLYTDRGRQLCRSPRESLTCPRTWEGASKMCIELRNLPGPRCVCVCTHTGSPVFCCRPTTPMHSRSRQACRGQSCRKTQARAHGP